MSNHLTTSQEAVLTFMLDYFHRNDQLPSAMAMLEHFGWASENTAVSYWTILTRKGWIERNECGKYRFVRNPVSA